MTMSKAKTKEYPIAYYDTGVSKFCVFIRRFVCYTVIGADNIHHASNKATKLWGPHWDNISEMKPPFHSMWTYCGVIEFGKRVKTIADLKL